MSDMIERVTKALIEVDSDRYPGECVDFGALAIAAVEAMREPTEQMTDAVYKHDPYDNGVGPENTWKYMIDTALGDKSV